jgi:hypothetical protein
MIEKDLTTRQLIEYKWKKYIQIGNTTYIKCPIHGELQPATVYGFEGWIECTKCLKIRVKQYEEENKIEG